METKTERLISAKRFELVFCANIVLEFLNVRNIDTSMLNAARIKHRKICINN